MASKTKAGIFLGFVVVFVVVFVIVVVCVLRFPGLVYYVYICCCSESEESFTLIFQFFFFLLMSLRSPRVAIILDTFSSLRDDQEMKEEPLTHKPVCFERLPVFFFP